MRLTDRRRQATSVAKRLTLAAGADLAIIVAATLIGWFMPIGMGGALLVGALLILVTLFALFGNFTPTVRAEQLPTVPLKLLPALASSNSSTVGSVASDRVTIASSCSPTSAGSSPR